MTPADLKRELDNAHRLIGQSIGWQRDAEIKIARLQIALKPFALNAHAPSLSEALGHVTREDLLRAAKALESA